VFSSLPVVRLKQIQRLLPMIAYTPCYFSNFHRLLLFSLNNS
jgi:hypothetical protein